jgi:hypothetical protein
MMPWIRSALQAAVTGDVQTSEIQAASTDTVLKLAAGQVAAQGWAAGDILRYAADSETGAKHDTTSTRAPTTG